MNSKLRLLLTLGFAALLNGCASRSPRPLPPNAIRPVIAVSSFENRSGSAGTHYPSQWLLGSGMAEVLLERLVGAEQFVTVERLQLDSVVEELIRQEMPLFRTEGRAGSGNLLNAKYLIRGTVTEFSQVSGGSFWIWLRGLFLLGKSSTARVALTLTIVEVATGKIVGSVQAEGFASAYEAYLEANYAEVTFGGEGFYQTPLGEATSDAMEDALYELVDRIPIEVWKPRIAAVNDEFIVINGGHDRGLRTGLRFRVRETPELVTDPMTGDPLTELAGRVVGEIEICEIRPRAAMARVITTSIAEDAQAFELPFERGQWLEFMGDQSATDGPTSSRNSNTPR